MINLGQNGPIAKKFKTKLQAHGSPGNLIDLYASADIPECETFGSMPFDIPGFRREKEDIREGDADPVMLEILFIGSTYFRKTIDFFRNFYLAERSF